MIDILFITVPKLVLRSPLLGPATLTAICKQNGFTSGVMDLNIDLWHRFRYKSMDHIWDEDDPTFMKKAAFNTFYDEYLVDITNEWITQIIQKDASFIGISILHQRNEHMAIRLIDEIRKRPALKDKKIIVGAPYASIVGCKLLNDGKIYAYVDGDAENAIIDILNGNLDKSGINGNTPEQIMNLDDYPFPDYSNHDLRLYVKGYDALDEPTETLFINGARGCIKRCKFCDVSTRWSVYIGKSGKRIADEVEHYIQLYPQIKKFLFTDSLLNGNVQLLSDFCKEKIERKLPVTFFGQWITRPPHIHPPEFYDLVKEAGLTHCIIGVESGSQKVINEMKKGVRLEDIYYTYEQLERVGISSTPLLLVGYPTETADDFQETISLLDGLKQYSKSNTISRISLGPTCILYEDTPVYDDIDKLGIVLDPKKNWGWYNSNSSFKDRIERWFELYDTAIELGYRIDERSTSWLLSEYKQMTGIDYNSNQIAQISRETHDSNNV